MLGNDHRALRSRQAWHDLVNRRYVVRSLAFSPDDTILATNVGSRAEVRLLAVPSGRELGRLKGHTDSVWSLAFSPDGMLATGAGDGTVRLWKVARGQMWRCLTGHAGFGRSVAFKPDGTMLALGADDGTVWLWEVASEQVQRCLTGHVGFVQSVAFSPDGTTLASASSDNTVRLWDVHTGTCLAILGHVPNGWVAYRPDGRYKLGGDIGNAFWHMIGLCRFEPGELDPYLPQPLRMRDDEPFIPRRAPRA